MRFLFVNFPERLNNFKQFSQAAILSRSVRSELESFDSKDSLLMHFQISDGYCAATVMSCGSSTETWHGALGAISSTEYRTFNSDLNMVVTSLLLTMCVDVTFL